MERKVVIKYLIILVVALSASFLVFAIKGSSEERFDSEAWKRAPLYGRDDIRYRMHKDLIARYTLIGLSKDEVIDLLGEESDTAYFKDWDLRYWMGPEPGIISVDSIWLVLRIKDERVIEYKIITD